jgi:hypothetical protein
MDFGALRDPRLENALLKLNTGGSTFDPDKNVAFKHELGAVAQRVDVNLPLAD